MALPAWYSGRVGLSALATALGGVVADYRKIRRGFHWDTPRPAGWAEPASAIPDRPSDLSWARTEPVRTIRQLLQRRLLNPFTWLMAQPNVEGREWVEGLDRPAILVANHNSHADTPLLLYALGDRAREKTVVAAAADYFYDNKWRGRLVSLWLNTFPFARMGSPAEVLHRSSVLLKSGWNLVVFPEGTRSPDGRIQEFRPGVGHLASENRVDVVPIHIRGARRIMPKGRPLPLPAPAAVRIGRPLHISEGETSRAFAERVERSVRALAAASDEVAVRGSWIDRWNATGARTPGRR